MIKGLRGKVETEEIKNPSKMEGLLFKLKRVGK